MITATVILLMVQNARSEGAPSSGDDAVEISSAVSTFTTPTTLREGRDPFHPNSTRVIAMMRPVEKAAPGPATLELKGISGTPENPLAIINNRTMAVGEEQQVTTPQGRVKVMCLEISGTKVTVKAQGQRRELLLRKGL